MSLRKAKCTIVTKWDICKSKNTEMTFPKPPVRNIEDKWEDSDDCLKNLKINNMVGTINVIWVHPTIEGKHVKLNLTLVV